ncbi:MAG TPA: hypothetical protein HA360_04375 [Nanoarchaeota archaeon]|nr:hypothetical protein [Candidatus Woesearchaeota archaeon]HIH14614.1 hypothetical protein [Nanoarchaeota archaeon]HIH58514.1 hypothetical protein [Nanoarchaeota archaeon]HII14283.1 hypothetical protein [Nanoarchaeota archaeon]HIJ05027.1 hypothetical protein [Nanoarchaeota archaeon]
MKKSVISKEQKVVLSKTYGWIILIGLIILDAFLDIIFAEGKGLESNILKPIADLFGISNPLFLTPLIIIIFYFGVKGGAWLIRKADKLENKSEELVLTTLVIVYGILVLWLISVYLFNFTLIKNHYYLIPILIIIGIAYSWWAEKKLKIKN